MRLPALLPLLLFAFLAVCDGPSPMGGESEEPNPPTPIGDRIPLTELGSGTYLGHRGGLYPDGANDPPDDHAAAGRAALARIEPLDGEGRPSPAGRIVLVSVGMSNTTQEFCGGNVRRCAAHSFAGQAALDSAVDRTELVIVDGAQGGEAAESWDDPGEATYDVVRDRRLAALGVTERQVQIAWVKQANPRPTASLPSPGADAHRLEASLGEIVRAMKARWPDLRIVFFSSRIYGGWATTALNPEPYAYESGLAVRWVIEAQIEQARTGRVDPGSGDLALERMPWLAWGPYLWADGLNPRADGLVWERGDFAADGTHPSPSGRQKVGAMLLGFFKSSPYSRCWFLAGLTCS